MQSFATKVLGGPDIPLERCRKGDFDQNGSTGEICYPGAGDSADRPRSDLDFAGDQRAAGQLHDGTDSVGLSRGSCGGCGRVASGADVAWAQVNPLGRKSHL